jgi:hypothetical protein
MATTVNSCFWLVDFQKSSSLKLLSQMNRNLVGSTYGRFCIKFSQSRMKGEQPVQLAKQFQRRFLEIDQSETRIDCGGHVC